MKGGAVALVGTAAVPSFLTRAVYGSTSPITGKKRLVVLFQRGAADGLNIVVPHGEQAYYSMRPTIAIPRPSTSQLSAIDLDGFFGLHPSMQAFKPLWDQGHLAIIHAAGSPDETRSHFDAQDFMESGTPGLKSTEDGWLNRAMQAGDPKQWTNESLMLVRSHAYDIGPSVELSDDYVEKARPIVRRRLAQAGIRLAWLLNIALK